MKGFIQSEHRGQGTLPPESLDDYVSDTNPVRLSTTSYTNERHGLGLDSAMIKPS